MNILKIIQDTYDNRFDPKTARTMTDFLWYGSIRLGVVLLLLSLACGGWLLYSAQGIVRAAKTDAGAVDTVSRAQLSAVLDTFRARTVQYDSTKKVTPSIIDPAH